MASTSFTDGVTLTAASWFNDINDGIYKGVGTTGYSTVASATTPDIFATTVSGVINYTGTTTCTGFTAAPSAGARRELHCAGAAVFTAGANMLIDGVSSGNNLTCSANDIVVVRAISTTQFRLSRWAYSGSSNGLVLIQRQTPSGVATCDFTTGISSTYDEYVVTFTDVRPATNGVNLWYRISEDGGSTFKSTGYYGGYSLVGDVTAGAFTSQSNQAQALIAVSVGNTAARPLSGELRFWSPSSTTTAKKCIASTIYGDGTTDEARFQQTGILYTPTPAAMNAIRFMFSSGNITSGSIALYGVSKA